MNKFNSSCFVLLALLFLAFTSHVTALEKEKLISFLQEYDASPQKNYGKVAYAIENGYPEIAEFFILKGEEIIQYGDYDFSDPNFTTRYFKHPVITATTKGYNDVAILMIELGFGNKAEEFKIEGKRENFSNGTYRINSTETKKKNAMSVAIDENHYEIVLSLLLAGFDVNTTGPLTPPSKQAFYDYVPQTAYPTPLLRAIEEKKLDIAELLLIHGADVEKMSYLPCPFETNGYQNDFRGSPLLKAVDDNSLEGVDLLLRFGANPLKGSPSPMDRAVQKGYFQIVDLLYDKL